MTVERPEVPRQADERQMLDAWLDWHRTTLLKKCEGVPADMLRERTVPPSKLSLLGLVRHMAEVERGWFQRGMAGEDAGRLYCSDEDPDGDFDNVDTANIDEAFTTWRAECDQSRKVAASFSSLDDSRPAARHRKVTSLRWVMLHMIEEYARHNGHADLLRERIDGATGT